MKPRRLSKAEQRSLILTIVSLGRQGEGLAVHDGKRIYVPGALPGETVRATLTDRVDRDVFRASADFIEEKSKDRVEAPCAHYDSCGGCVLQHLEENAYKTWKAGQVLERLNRSGIEAAHWDDPVFIPRATRRRATFAVMKQGRRLLAGFNGSRSHRIVDIAACLLLHPALMKALEGAKPWLSGILKEGNAADLFLQDVDGQVEGVLTGPLARDGADLGLREAFSGWAAATGMNRIAWRRGVRDEPEIMIQARPMLARFGRMIVPLSPGAFLQPSREGEAALTQAVLTFLGESGYEDGTAIADLFSGCGTFTGPLLDRGPVHAVEIGDGPAKALKAARAGPTLSVEKRDLFTRPLNGLELKKVGAVVLDPPRAGAQAQAAELANSEVPAVIYVSCNPATFVKDSGMLVDGGFRIQRLRLIDQFIWSAHMELVGLFTR